MVIPWSTTMAFCHLEPSTSLAIVVKPSKMRSRRASQDPAQPAVSTSTIPGQPPLLPNDGVINLKRHVVEPQKEFPCHRLHQTPSTIRGCAYHNGMNLPVNPNSSSTTLYLMVRPESLDTAWNRNPVAASHVDQSQFMNPSFPSQGTIRPTLTRPMVLNMVFPWRGIIQFVFAIFILLQLFSYK